MFNETRNMSVQNGVEGLVKKIITEDEAKEGRTNRINAVLEKAGVEKESYLEALSFNSSGYSVVMARDVDKLMVNSYNPEIAILP